MLRLLLQRTVFSLGVSRGLSLPGIWGGPVPHLGVQRNWQQPDLKIGLALKYLHPLYPSQCNKLRGSGHLPRLPRDWGEGSPFAAEPRTRPELSQASGGGLGEAKLGPDAALASSSGMRLGIRTKCLGCR